MRVASRVSARELPLCRSSEAIASLLRPIDGACCVRFVTPANSHTDTPVVSNVRERDKCVKFRAADRSGRPSPSVSFLAMGSECEGIPLHPDGLRRSFVSLTQQPYFPSQPAELPRSAHGSVGAASAETRGVPVESGYAVERRGSVSRQNAQQAMISHLAKCEIIASGSARRGRGVLNAGAIGGRYSTSQVANAVRSASSASPLGLNSWPT